MKYTMLGRFVKVRLSLQEYLHGRQRTCQPKLSIPCRKTTSSCSSVGEARRSEGPSGKRVMGDVLKVEGHRITE